MKLKTLAALIKKALRTYPSSADADIVIENKDTPHAHETRPVFGLQHGFKFSIKPPGDGDSVVVIGYIDATKVHRPKRKPRKVKTNG